MDVPLLYLPWMSFPLGSERKSGFLFPSIGNTPRRRLSARAAVLLEHRARTRTSPSSPTEYTQARHRPRRRPALPHRAPARRARLELPAHDDVNAGAAAAACELQRRRRAAGRLAPDGRRRERQRHAATSRTSPRARKARARVPERAAPRSPTAASTGASRPQVQEYQTIDRESGGLAGRPYARLPRVLVDADYGSARRARAALWL